MPPTATNKWKTVCRSCGVEWVEDDSLPDDPHQRVNQVERLTMPATQTTSSETTLEYVSPDLLDFDPNNPRFASLLTSRKPEAIQKALLGEPYYASELIDSLLANGYIDYEPLVVERSGQRYKVIEGNRRLAAIQEIRSNTQKYKDFEKTGDLESIPVLVFPEIPNAQQDNEMRVYLGVRHLLGFREWPPISKAQFLERESQKAGGLDKVIAETRISKTQARRFLVPFRLLKKANEKLPNGEDFWVLGESLSRAGVKDFIRLEVDPQSLTVLSYDRKRLSQLLSDLYGPKDSNGARDASKRKVSDTRALSRLAHVLSSDKASAVLHAGKSLEEAEIYVDSREQSLKRLAKLTKELHVLLRKILKGQRSGGTQLLVSYKSFDDAVKSYLSKEAKE